MAIVLQENQTTRTTRLSRKPHRHFCWNKATKLRQKKPLKPLHQKNVHFFNEHPMVHVCFWASMFLHLNIGAQRSTISSIRFTKALRSSWMRRPGVCGARCGEEKDRLFLLYPSNPWRSLGSSYMIPSLKLTARTWKYTPGSLEIPIGNHHFWVLC